MIQSIRDIARKVWHVLAHAARMNHGIVESRIVDGKILIGFKCTGCGKLYDEHECKNA